MGEGQADRVAGPIFRAQAAAHGAGPEDVSRIAAAWRRWGEDPGAWFSIPSGELLARLDP